MELFIARLVDIHIYTYPAGKFIFYKKKSLASLVILGVKINKAQYLISIDLLNVVHRLDSTLYRGTVLCLKVSDNMPTTLALCVSKSMLYILILA